MCDALLDDDSVEVFALAGILVLDELNLHIFSDVN